MNRRLRLTLMAISTIVLLGVLAFVAFSDPTPSDDQAAIQSGSFAGALRPETPPASFTLRDEEGRPVDIADFRGQPVVVTFLYSSCETSDGSTSRICSFTRLSNSAPETLTLVLLDFRWIRPTLLQKG